MVEVNVVDPKVMSPEMLERQNELRDLWQSLEKLPQININEPLDIETSSLMKIQDIEDDKTPGVKGKPGRVEKILDLERGKFMAVKESYGSFETYHLFGLAKDGRFGTEFPLGRLVLEVKYDKKPVIVYPDRENFLLRPVKLEKIPAGFRINWSNPESDPHYNHDGNERYFLYQQRQAVFHRLNDSLVHQAKRILEDLASSI